MTRKEDDRKMTGKQLSCLGLAQVSPLVSSSDKRSAFRGSLDIRAKPEHDREEEKK